jgi:phenylacetate-CoA ligase
MFELVLFLLGYNIKKSLENIDYIKKLSKKDFIRWQDEKKWEIVRYHYKNNDFYRKIVGKVFPNKWKDLPSLKKTDFQNPLSELLSKGLSLKNTYVANTSGSSGHPFSFAKDKDCHARTWAFWKIRYNELGLSFNSKEARFFGHVTNFKTRIFEKIKDFVLNRYRFNVFDLSDNALHSFIKTFKHKKFDYVYGYTQTIAIFAKYLIKKNIILKDICPSLKLVIVTAEICSDYDRTVIEKGFGLPLKDEYGASEVGYMASECDFGNWHIVGENILIETNEKNEILVTDFFNLAQPFIRYNIGDLGFISNEVDCKCDNKNLILSKFQGRTNDVIKLPNGKISPGLTFYYVSRTLLESYGSIEEFIVIQTHIDKFVFKIISDIPINAEIEKDIEKSMENYLCSGLKFELQKVDAIKRSPSGKIKHFFSEL